jgi:hypothetical protein
VSCLVLLTFSSSSTTPSIIVQASIDWVRADVTDDWFVVDSEDEDASRPVEIADQSGLLSGNPFSTGSEKILQRQEIFKLYVLYRMLTKHNFA